MRFSLLRWPTISLVSCKMTNLPHISSKCHTWPWTWVKLIIELSLCARWCRRKVQADSPLLVRCTHSVGTYVLEGKCTFSYPLSFSSLCTRSPPPMSTLNPVMKDLHFENLAPDHWAAYTTVGTLLATRRQVSPILAFLGETWSKISVGQQCQIPPKSRLGDQVFSGLSAGVSLQVMDSRNVNDSPKVPPEPRWPPESA